MSTSSHSDDAEALLGKAQEAYLAHFPPTVSFERAVFFSWGCTIGDCQFCYMSTQPDSKKPTETKRSNASILAEFILAKHLGWDIGFFTGGIGVLKPDELEFLLKAIFQITNEKIWLSVGPVSKPLLQRYLPYIRGVVGSTETISPILHKKVCPSKPLAPYERMFEAAKELNLERQIVVCRELTKIYETVYRGTAAEILERLSANEEEVKGEFVVIVEGK